MPNREKPDFYPEKTGFQFYQSREESGRFSGVKINQVEFDRHSPEKFAQLLNEGPCVIHFRRVTYGDGGSRIMKCIKPSVLPKNAFDPKFPGLIAVIDLDIGKWRSFYYEQTKMIKRLLPNELSYEERKNAMRVTGGDYDKLFPGAEEYNLQGHQLNEKLKPSLGGHDPFVLTNQQEENKYRNEVLRDALRRKEENLRIAREQRQQILEKLQATDNFNTANRNNQG